MLTGMPVNTWNSATMNVKHDTANDSAKNSDAQRIRGEDFPDVLGRRRHGWNYTTVRPSPYIPDIRLS